MNRLAPRVRLYCRLCREFDLQMSVARYGFSEGRFQAWYLSRARRFPRTELLKSSSWTDVPNRVPSGPVMSTRIEAFVGAEKWIAPRRNNSELLMIE